ncbi:TatD family hydrolase, partial [Salmonella enterica]
MSWRFIDTHCHFDFPPFTGDERASIQRACEVGVEKIIVPATEAAHFPRVLALAARFPSLYAALGLHPIVIERHADDDPDKLQQALAQQQNVVAVGEIGLDLYRDDPQFSRQERFLDAQLQLAKRYDLPVILHSRRTHDKLAM